MFFNGLLDNFLQVDFWRHERNAIQEIYAHMEGVVGGRILWLIAMKFITTNITHLRVNTNLQM